MSTAAESSGAQSEAIVCFGAFEINFETRELRKHGLKLKLPEQSFRVLAVLLEDPGRVVAREELRRRLWSEDTHVEFERNLNTIMHNLRSVLGDSARQPRFIDTVHGRGYRFVGPVAPRRRGTRPPRRRALTYAALAALASLAMWAALKDSDSAPGALPPRPRLIPLTSSVGVEGGPSFSPDGKQVVFHWDGVDRKAFNIYVKSVGSEDLLRLTEGPEQDRNPAWSPDGVHIAFVRALPDYQAAVMLVPAQGGTAREVVTIPAKGTTLSWSPDGRWILYSTAGPDYVRAPASDLGIFAVEVASGRPKRVTTPKPSAQGDAYPAVSRDGRRLVFVRRSSNAVGELYVVGVNRDLELTDAPRRLTFADRGTRSPAWTADGSEIIFATGLGHSFSLWRASVEDGAPAPPTPLGVYGGQEPAVSPHGDRIAFSSLIETDELWKITLLGPRPSGGPAQRITYSTKRNRGPAFSPAGTRLAFQSNRSGRTEIWICDLDGGNLKQVSSFRGTNSGTPNWSPDGTRIVADTRIDGHGEIFVLDLESGTSRRLTSHPADDVTPSWSRNGRWIYFASNRSSRFQVWKAPAEGGPAVQVTQGGGFHALESFDGRTLYYAKSVLETSIWQVPVQGGEESMLIDSLSDWANFGLSHDGIFFTPVSDETRTEIRFFDFAAGESRLIETIDTPFNGGLDSSADGKTVVFSKPERAESDLILMDLAPPARRRKDPPRVAASSIR